MTYKFVAVKEKNLTLPVPIYGEEPVAVQFQLGFFETDKDYIGISMRQHKEYGILFYEFGDIPKSKEKPVKSRKQELVDAIPETKKQVEKIAEDLYKPKKYNKPVKKTAKRKTK